MLTSNATHSVKETSTVHPNPPPPLAPTIYCLRYDDPTQTASAMECIPIKLKTRHLCYRIDENFLQILTQYVHLMNRFH